MRRIGIIGTGQIAQGHLRQWAQIDEIEVVAACDIDAAALKATCDTFGIAEYRSTGGWDCPVFFRADSSAHASGSSWTFERFCQRAALS